MLTSIDSKKWNYFLHKYFDLWMKRIENWVLKVSSDHPVLVVRYEDLKEKPVQEIIRMLSFLKVPFTEGDLLVRMRDDYVTFKRKHDERDSFEHYTSDQKTHIKSIILEAIKLAEKNSMQHVLNLSEYLNKLE